MSIGKPAYFPCPECNRMSKVVETKPRKGWKYRHYVCPQGHAFSTREQAYTPLSQGHDFVWRKHHG